jgi:hypothetical protein
MPWCPKCKNEYPADCETCWSCGGKLIATDPADIDITSAHSDERPAGGCSQILSVWFVAFVALSAFFLLSYTITSISSVAAALIPIPTCLLLIFGGGFLFGQQLTPRYVWIAWGMAGIPAYIIMGYVAALTDCRCSPGRFAVMMLLLFPSLGAVVTSSGIRFRRTKHWAYIVLPIVFACFVAVWLRVVGY